MSNRLIDSPVFRTLWLCFTASSLGYFTYTEDWLWAGLLSAMVILDVVDLVKAALKYGRKHRFLQVASCATTLICVYCSAMAWYCFSIGQLWQGWVNVVLAVINVGLVYQQRKTLKKVVELDVKIEQWKAEFFPDDQYSTTTKEGASNGQASTQWK